MLSRPQFEQDLQANLLVLKTFAPSAAITHFMPPYEWYNEQITHWSQQQGLQLINFTPGTGTNADYTTPSMKNYRSSVQLYERLLDFEQKNPTRLNGAIVLIHLGTDPARKDKFYRRLPQLIVELKGKGYGFGQF